MWPTGLIQPIELLHLAPQATGTWGHGLPHILGLLGPTERGHQQQGDK